MYILYYIIFLAAAEYKKNYFLENEIMRFSFTWRFQCYYLPFFFHTFFLKFYFSMIQFTKYRCRDKRILFCNAIFLYDREFLWQNWQYSYRITLHLIGDERVLDLRKFVRLFLYSVLNCYLKSLRSIKSLSKYILFTY